MNVAALVFLRKGDSILLVKQDYEPGYWSLPGGVVENGETIEAAVIREVKEETGLDIRILKLVGLYSKPSENNLAVTFAGEEIGGELNATGEISDCSYFPLESLPAHVREHFHQRLVDYLSDQSQAFIRTQ